jgi:hypothetical protein
MISSGNKRQQSRDLLKKHDFEPYCPLVRVMKPVATRFLSLAQRKAEVRPERPVWVSPPSLQSANWRFARRSRQKVLPGGKSNAGATARGPASRRS